VRWVDDEDELLTAAREALRDGVERDEDAANWMVLVLVQLLPRT
jgi:hypothetical protein